VDDGCHRGGGGRGVADGRDGARVPTSDAEIVAGIQRGRGKADEGMGHIDPRPLDHRLGTRANHGHRGRVSGFDTVGSGMGRPDGKAGGPD